MAETNKPDSIFQGVMDAITGGKRRTPEMAPTSNFQGIAPPKGSGLIAGAGNAIEEYQQQYLDWQVNKISHNLYQRTLYFDTDRIGAYQDFRAMDMSPEISAALNIIRDECLTRNERGNILEIYSENARVKEVIKDLTKRLNLEFNLKLWIRDLIKYGDYFVLLNVDKEEGIYNFITLPPEEVHREDGYDNKPDAVRFRWETLNEYFEEWQIAHFRLIEDTRKIPYGRSILDPARKLWKQLQLAEDSMLVYRITRAPERRVFYIEIGNLEEADIKQYVAKIQNQIKKAPIADQRNGNVNFKYNPMNITEDFFIPIRGDKSSRIDTLPGASNLGDIQDIEYLQNKLFASLQVPKAYLNYAENLPGGSTLSQADLRFARTINSIQEVVLMELRRVINVHLYFSGFRDDIDNFSLSFTNPSTQQELLKLETMKARLEVAKEYYSPDATSFASWTWVMQNILGFSNQDIKLILRQKKVEKKVFAEIDAAVDTYKKIGLFTDLDAKYEIPGAVPQGTENAGGDAAAAAGGGGGGGDTAGIGNMDIGTQTGGGAGGGGDMGGGAAGGDMGGGAGGTEAGAGGGAEAGAEAAPLAESKTVKLKKALKESDNRFETYLNDLLGEDETPKIDLSQENSLIKNNNKLNYKTQKLMEKIQKAIDNDMSTESVVPDNLIQESVNEMPLFSNGERLIHETNEMLSAFENMLKSRENDDVISEEIIEEDVINEDSVDVEETSYENVEDVENTGDDTPDEDLSHENDSGETEEDTDAV